MTQLYEFECIENPNAFGEMMVDIRDGNVPPLLEMYSESVNEFIIENGEKYRAVLQSSEEGKSEVNDIEEIVDFFSTKKCAGYALTYQSNSPDFGVISLSLKNREADFRALESVFMHLSVLGGVLVIRCEFLDDFDVIYCYTAEGETGVLPMPPEFLNDFFGALVDDSEAECFFDIYYPPVPADNGNQRA